MTNIGDKIQTPWGEGIAIDRNQMASGKEAFKIMETHGIPLELIVDLLKEKGYVLNTIEFIETALASSNFSEKSIKNRMCFQLNMPEPLFEACMVYIRKKNELR